MELQGKVDVIMSSKDAEMSSGRDDVAVYIDGLLEERRNTTQYKPTIFEVDDRLREVRKKDYEPKIISIGPIHYGNNCVKSMEQHKLRFLEELLRDNISNYGPNVDRLVQVVREMEASARHCYGGSVNLKKNEFVRMLLLDCCFIIKLLRNLFFGKTQDPIFESETLIQITHDLLLFENQLPFFVLSRLFDMTRTHDPDDDLRRLILFLVGDILPWWSDDSNTKPLRHDDEDHHILGLVYRSIPPKLDSSSHTQHPLNYLLRRVIQTVRVPFKANVRKWRESGAGGKKSPVIHINSASELREIGGIRLKMSEDNSIIFAGKVLKIPPLQVSGETESLLRNLMAYEQLQLDDNHQRHVIDYVFFFHCLIRSMKDIEILRYSGIIKNYLGGDQKILQMFDRLGTNFMRSSEYSHSDVFDSLNRHCSRQRNEWIATLRRTYFNSPWSAIKFIAATFLLLLAATQTLFAILSFRKQKSS